jgi:hypothetical protein
MPLKTVHCRLCGKAIKGVDFAERMAKLRHHRKLYHPIAHKRSVAKAMVTKGYDRQWRRKAKLDPTKDEEKESVKALKMAMALSGDFDPLKVRRGLIKKPKVITYTDANASGLIRILERQDGTLFPEFALYCKTYLLKTTESLKQAGFKQEARGKWVLRTNKFNIFVYV